MLGNTALYSLGEEVDSPLFLLGRRLSIYPARQVASESVPCGLSDAWSSLPLKKLTVLNYLPEARLDAARKEGEGGAMAIKQQRDIEKYLVERVGQEAARELVARQSELLEKLIAGTSGKSKKQMETLEQTILPRVALFKALEEQVSSSEEVTELMRGYMMDVVSAQKHAFTAGMQVVPGFFDIYKCVFLRVMGTSDLWESTQSHGRDFFDARITRCLWHDACVENGCPELCPLFCDVDDVNYGGLRKMGFSRTKTLGYGGDCCDFHFYRRG